MFHILSWNISSHFMDLESGGPRAKSSNTNVVGGTHFLLPSLKRKKVFLTNKIGKEIVIISMVNIVIEKKEQIISLKASSQG